jgi:predicted HD phosphohydrolase
MFTALSESSAADWALIHAADQRFDATHAERILALLEALGAAGSALPVSRLEHSLQTATRAHQNGEAEAYVVAALLHDLGELYCPENHGAFAAALLRPYVDDTLDFILRNHTIFQGYHFWHVLGGDRHARDAWRGHPAFGATVRFCALYDQRSFDANFRSMPLSEFEPLLRRVLARPRPDFEPHAVPLGGRVVRKIRRLARALTGSKAIP